MKKKIFILLLLLALLAIPAGALAQDYSFELPQETVHVFWNEDGTSSIDYVFNFNNDTFGHVIDYVDVGLPGPNFDESSIRADVNGIPVSDISAAGFQGEGPYGKVGVAVGLGPNSIPPGESGQVHVFVGSVGDVLRPDTQDNNYASAVFSPAWFTTVNGSTDLSVTYHLPPGVQPEEPRWHEAPAGFSGEPQTGLDDQGRVTYTWGPAAVTMDRKYDFGASFPKQYVRPGHQAARPGRSLNISTDALIGMLVCGGIVAFVILSGFVGVYSSRKRKLQYLPPRIAIEGHGIKRGLTAVEAAILLEEPLDKVLTMALFGVIKKGAASVEKRDPLELKVADSLPTDLQPYESQFLEAFKKEKPAERKRLLQDMTIDLIKGVQNKMKGFSRKETIAYYRDIMNRAWAQVEAADTPEVKAQKYDEVMEWTMLDREYDDRTRRVFGPGPVYVPVWWPRYDPTFGRGTVSAPTSGSGPQSGGGTGPVMPQLPGSEFAASVVGGVQGFASNVIGNVTEFTGNITDRTNPVPVTTTTSTRSGGGRAGGGCACACACAGCACACAGGGR
jgi:hypothetical protein